MMLMSYFDDVRYAGFRFCPAEKIVPSLFPSDDFR